MRFGASPPTSYPSELPESAAKRPCHEGVCFSGLDPNRKWRNRNSTTSSAQARTALASIWVNLLQQQELPFLHSPFYA
jgi:hypothetical protein